MIYSYKFHRFLAGYRPQELLRSSLWNVVSGRVQKELGSLNRRHKSRRFCLWTHEHHRLFRWIHSPSLPRLVHSPHCGHSSINAESDPNDLFGQCVHPTPSTDVRFALSCSGLFRRGRNRPHVRSFSAVCPLCLSGRSAGPEFYLHRDEDLVATRDHRQQFYCFESLWLFECGLDRSDDQTLPRTHVPPSPHTAVQLCRSQTKDWVSSSEDRMNANRARLQISDRVHSSSSVAHKNRRFERSNHSLMITGICVTHRVYALNKKVLKSDCKVATNLCQLKRTSLLLSFGRHANPRQEKDRRNHSIRLFRFICRLKTRGRTKKGCRRSKGSKWCSLSPTRSYWAEW